MSRIKIYSRVRPATRPFKGLQLSKEDGSSLSINIGFQDNISKRPQSRYSQAPPSSHHFKFARVFDQDAPQEDIFDHVAKHMIDRFLGGFNGTIFAYGQTSSGKTYTIEGSSRSYAERGLIPRTISYVFEDVERRLGMGEDVTVHVSYMEIYQDVGYDLLNPGTRPGALMVTLPKVQVIEGAGGEVVVRNLSVHLAANEEVALSLLFQGSTCRRVAETSMNQCSSRSHTIFTLSLIAKTPGKEAIIKSKLHLVDLAGSERVAKTGADGLVLQEAKHINLSLHHLEHVIVSLQQLARHKQGTAMLMSGTDRSGSSPASPFRTGQSRQSHRDRSPNISGLTTPTYSEHVVGHVPYRNSMLTMVLRDSLGGNCLTAMIATISAEENNIWESVSTCRFSQRVACISNQAKRNEELDDKVVIKRLRKKVAELEAELEAQKVENNSQGTHLPNGVLPAVSHLSLSSADQKVCHQILNDFFHGKLDNPVRAGINTTAKFQECLFVMREIVLHALGIQRQQQSSKIKAASKTRSEERRKHHRLNEARGSSSTPANGAGRGEGDVVDIEVSPESQSRLSSGFGSLHGEGSSEKLSKGWGQRGDTSEVGKEPGSLESRGRRSRWETMNSEEGKRERLHCRRQAWATTSQSPPAASTDSQDDSWFGNHSSSTTASGCSPPMDQSHNNRLTAAANATLSPTSPSIQTSVSPSNHVPSPSYETQQTHKYSLLRQSPSANRRKASIKRTGTAGPDMQTALEEPLRGSRHVELRQSQEEEKRLQQHLHRANLELQGQQAIDDLELLREKLAAQHALVKRMERSGTSTPDDVRSETIVEQQLRIKQAKLHHRLQSIQQEWSSQNKQEEMNARRNGDVFSSNSLPSSSSSSASRDNEPGSVKARSHNKEERLRVEGELERLKMSRKEKELQLKEAVTRMKIRALKQQLMGTHKTTDFAATTEHSLLAGRAAQKTSEPHLHEYTHKLPADSEHTSSVNHDKLYYLQQADQILNVSEDANHSLFTYGATPPPSQPGIATATPPNYAFSSATHLHHSASLTTPPHHSASLTTPPHHSASLTTPPHHSASLTTPPHHTATQLHHQTPSSPFNQPLHSHISSSPPAHDHTPSSPTPQQLAITAPSGHPAVRTNTAPSHTKVLAERLTLLPEIKETEYMTAVQKQKVRVNRIRRCMIAATVIQRAWRRRHSKHFPHRQ